MTMNKRSQAWGIDLIFGIMIFSVGIMIFFIYSVNQSGETKESLVNLGHDGDNILSNLLSDGYPTDWNSSNVIEIGILSNNKINETKLERFYNFTINNYAQTRSIFKTRYNYYLSFDNMTINSIVIDGIGKPGVNRTNLNINATNLIKITRLSIYKDKPATIYLYVWEE